MKAQRYNAYDVQVASKTDPAARYVLASDYAKLEADLAAANATLDRLRDVVPEDFSCNWCDKCNKFVNLVSEQDYEDTWTRCENCGSIMYDQSTDAAEFLRAILHPQPETPDAVG